MRLLYHTPRFETGQDKNKRLSQWELNRVFCHPRNYCYDIFLIDSVKNPSQTNHRPVTAQTNLHLQSAFFRAFLGLFPILCRGIFLHCYIARAVAR